MRARTFPLLLAATVLLLAAPPARAENDPLEPVNRRVHGFNQVLRGWVLDPAASAWMSATSPGFRAGVSNALDNLGEPISAAAGLAAGEFRLATNALIRFGLNTTVGLGGVRDRAADWGYHRRPFAVADTLCSWGVPSGPFLVLPMLGPSTLRDAGATFATHVALSGTFGSEAVVSWRASDLFVGYAPFHEEFRRIDADALDSYAVHRSAFLQRRAFACATDRREEVAEGD